MRHGKGMFLSSCGCCSRGLTDLLSLSLDGFPEKRVAESVWVTGREEGVQGWKRLRMGVEQEGGRTGGGQCHLAY